MNSNIHYPIDLNEDQNHQSFFCNLGTSSFNQAASSASSSSLSHLPFLINSQQEHVEYNTANYHVDHNHLSQSLEAKMLMPNGESSCDHMVPKKETRLKLTIRKKEERTDLLIDQNQTKADHGGSLPTTTVKWMSSKMRLMKKMITNKQPINQNLQTDDISYGNNNGVIIRVCSDCNTTKTPLWRSGPRGPKSLCNACGIRQRKARRAAMAAAAAAADNSSEAQPPQQLTLTKKKTQNKNKRSNDHFNPPPKPKKCKITALTVADSETPTKSSPLSSSSSSNKFSFDDLTIILSKSSAFQQVFPQDEKEAAILLMALSYGMVHS